MTWKIIEGESLAMLKTLPSGSVHCVVTSPPYWNLRDYGQEDQLGLEPTPQEYVERMVEIFREIRRVLRHDGTVWLNLGDSYAAGSVGGNTKTGFNSRYFGREIADGKQGETGEQYATMDRTNHGLKVKDLVGIPWRVAFALQDDGWWLRSDIIWAKPNPMPESVSSRPTKSHEYVFLLAKSARYFYDSEAIKEPAKQDWGERDRSGGKYHQEGTGFTPHKGLEQSYASRNRRSVWTITTQPFPGAHFAVMPISLVVPCVKAGTSEHGCCSACGEPFVRQTERVGGPPSGDHRQRDDGITGGKTAHETGTLAGSHLSNVYAEYGYAKIVTTGWEAACECEAEVSPCVVMDPFSGSGTVGVVATRFNRSYIGIELSPEYAEMSRRRIEGDAPLFNRKEAK